MCWFHFVVEFFFQVDPNVGFLCTTCLSYHYTVGEPHPRLHCKWLLVIFPEKGKGLIPRWASEWPSACERSTSVSGSLRSKTSAIFKSCFHLFLIYWWDFTDWKKITWEKLSYLQSFFPAPAHDYWQVLWPCSEGWTNAFLQMTVRQGKIEFSLPSICVW